VLEVIIKLRLAARGSCNRLYLIKPIQCRPIGRYSPGKNFAEGPPQNRAQFVIIRQVARKALPTRSRHVARVHKRRFRRNYAAKSTLKDQRLRDRENMTKQTNHKKVIPAEEELKER
jgi:hypothetical protein